MDWQLILLTVLLSVREVVNEGTNPNRFYSTFGSNALYYQSDFSNHSSFLKLRDYLHSTGVVRNDSVKIILNPGNASIGYLDLKYQLHTSGNITKLSKTEKLCHLKVSEIEGHDRRHFNRGTKLSMSSSKLTNQRCNSSKDVPPRTGDILLLLPASYKFILRFGESILTNIIPEEKPVSHISWKCPPYAWCCGAECCQHYYKDPWPLLGPDFYELIISIAVFAGLLLILELHRRWRKRKENRGPVLAVSPGTSGEILESSENVRFIM